MARPKSGNVGALMPTNQILLLNVLGHAGGYMSANAIVSVLMKFDELELSDGSLRQALRALHEKSFVRRVGIPGSSSTYRWGITELGAEALRIHRQVLGRLEISSRLVTES